jgi:homoserine O-succinyltransferase
MPIKIPNQLPAREVLVNENIFVMDESKALRQDIRAIRIAILNLMPTKITTETQLLRLIGNTPLQVEPVFIRTFTHRSKNTPQQHLKTFYKTFRDVKDQKFDGLIVTGAPVEHLSFEEVDYWEELREVFSWASDNVFAHLYICWAAQAALFHHFGIQKRPLPAKKFGTFSHRVVKQNVKLLRGFDDEFYAPHSRHTEIPREDVEREAQLEILADSEEAGLYIIGTNDERMLFITGHTEYDPLTLKTEYDRDLAANKPIQVPINYYPDNDPNQMPVVRWRSHAHLLFSNWINYYVYQETPYNLDQITGVQTNF